MSVVLFFDPVEQQQLARERLIHYVALIQQMADIMRAWSIAQSRFRRDQAQAIRDNPGITRIVPYRYLDNPGKCCSCA
ncbi:hypothetical protein K438DRAFT_1971853 [Mycena galopus ATCC 62051]|nr:hypothetical protein K438DRAFT_1971853 [Mycena galopus ATCC 62051]